MKETGGFRIERIVAKITRRQPGRTDGKAHDNCRGDLLAARTETVIAKAEIEERSSDQRRHDRPGRALGQTGDENKEFGNARVSHGGRYKVSAFDDGRSDIGQRTTEREISKNSKRCQIDQRPKIATAKSYQRAIAAGADQRHAKAEDRAAGEGAKPSEGPAKIDGLANIHGTTQMQDLRTQDGDGNGQDPRAKPSSITDDHGIGNGALACRIVPSEKAAPMSAPRVNPAKITSVASSNTKSPWFALCRTQAC